MCKINYHKYKIFFIENVNNRFFNFANQNNIFIEKKLKNYPTSINDIVCIVRKFVRLCNTIFA